MIAICEPNSLSLLVYSEKRKQTLDYRVRWTYTYTRLNQPQPTCSHEIDFGALSYLIGKKKKKKKERETDRQNNSSKQGVTENA